MAAGWRSGGDDGTYGCTPRAPLCAALALNARPTSNAPLLARALLEQLPKPNRRKGDARRGESEVEPEQRWRQLGAAVPDEGRACGEEGQPKEREAREQGAVQGALCPLPPQPENPLEISQPQNNC